MSVDIEKLLRSDSHSEFIAGLEAAQAKAMLDLLLVASLADDIVTVEERKDIATAFTQHPDLPGTLNLYQSPLIDYIDAIAARWKKNPEALLDEISNGLGDTDTRERALSAATFVMRTNDLVEEERQLIRLLARRWDIEPGFVRAAAIEINED